MLPIDPMDTHTPSSHARATPLATKPTVMSFVDQALSNGVFISFRGRLRQKLGTRLTKRTVRLRRYIFYAPGSEKSEKTNCNIAFRLSMDRFGEKTY